MAERYDCLAIGSGEAGKLVPMMLSSKKGMRCATIERKWIGGSCPNIACLPSKNFLHSASVIHDTREAHEYGLDVPSMADIQVNMAVVKKRKNDMVRAVNGFQDLFTATKTEIIRGDARFIGPKLIQLDNGRLLTAEHIVICTGSRALVDDTIPGLVDAQPMTHIDILNSETVPSHLIVIGGGYVGLEFAQAFRRFGAKVSIVQRPEQVLVGQDKDVVDILCDVFAKEGIDILTNTKVVSVTGKSGDGVTLELVSTSADRSIKTSLQGSHILVATGRVPNTDGLGLDAAGIRTTVSNHVAVDEHLRTSVPGVYAAGDCANSPYFTHMGWDDYRIIYGQITKSPRPIGTVGRLVPSVLFTSPQLASVGLNKRAAQEQGIKYRIAKTSMGSAFLYTQTLGGNATVGFAKVLVEAEGDKILGFVALGPGAGELLPVVSLAMKLGAGYHEIVDLIIAHPTLNEGLVQMFGEVPDVV